MNEMELQTTLDPIEMDMGDPEIVYSPVLPNPEGEPTDDLTKVQIQGNIYQIKDPEVHDWARAEEKPTYTKEEVGLGNVDDTSDMDKPVSTATQTALDGKVDDSELGNYYTKSEVNSALDYKADKSDTYTKTETDNLLSEKADSSSVYTKTETDTALGNKVDKVAGKGLSTNDYDNTAKGIVDGVTSALDGKVDKDGDKVLSDNNYSDTDKTKLDGIEAEANKTIVDNALDGTSANPVENRVVKSALDEKLNADETAVNSNGLVIATPVTDTAPYIYRQTSVKESFKALMKKIVGASVVWNQLAPQITSTNYVENVNASTTFSNNKVTCVCVGGTAGIYQNTNSRFSITGHKYLISIVINTEQAGSFQIGFENIGGSKAISDTNKDMRFAIVQSATADGTALVCYKVSSSENDTFTVSKYNAVDLTAMFGTTIADYVYTLETSQSGSGIAWLQSYGFFTEDYYAYKQNKLESGCVSAHKTYDGETLLTNTELSPITLRGLFKLSTDKLTVDGDEYNADGSVTRKRKRLTPTDIFEHYSSYDSTTNLYRSNFKDNLNAITKSGGSDKNPSNAISNFDTCESTWNEMQVFDHSNKIGLYHNTNWNYSRLYISIADTSVTTKEQAETWIRNNIEAIEYELETPTTEQTTPFTETEIVGNTEEFVDYEVAQGNRDVAIPVGTETDYYQEMKLPSLPTTSGNHNLIYNIATGFGWS